MKTAAIVGGESLLGRDLREVLADYDLTLIGADDESVGKLTETGDEATIITTLDETHLASANVVVLAGSAASGRKAWTIMEAHPKIPVVDATRTLEDLSSARLCAPLADVAASGHPAVIAHSAAIAL